MLDSSQPATCASNGYDAHVTDRRTQLVHALESPARDTTLDERVAIAERLGELGDPRSLEWVEVPGGVFVMGTDPEVEPEQKPHESPQIEPDLRPFEIMRTPVTVARFEGFVRAGGYETREHWSPEGWAFRSEGALRCPRFASPEERAEWGPYLTPSRPVVGVSWFEAEAYARWAGVRLPTEAEWEKAARGTQGFVYPWGNDWEEDRAAHRGQGPRKTLPVGVFPRGESPYGALDMVGSVWQWCSDAYAPDAYVHAESRDPTGPPASGRASRVVRGGAWNTLPFSLRCANRNSYPPTARFSNLGFRCARSG
jgi:formylglycine-generating enzyme required for sulfatase activity